MNTKPIFRMTLHNIVQTVETGFIAGLAFFFFGGVVLIAVFFNVLSDSANQREIELSNYLPTLIITAVLMSAIALFMRVYSIVQSYMKKRRIHKLLTGELLATWTYEPTEWQQLVEAQRLYDMSLIGQTGWKVLFIIAGGIIVLWSGLALTVEGLPATIRYMFASIGIFIAVIIVASSLAYKMRQPIMVRRVYERRRRQSEPTLYIGAQAMYHNTEGYFSFKDLISVRLDDDEPPSLIFTIRVYIPKSGDMDIPFTIPIPRARVKDAVPLVGFFHKYLARVR